MLLEVSAMKIYFNSNSYHMYVSLIQITEDKHLTLSQLYREFFQLFLSVTCFHHHFHWLFLV